MVSISYQKTAEKTKVLAIAEGANPEMVSVPLIGWSISSALREVANVHIVTQIRNREAFLSHGLVEGRDFTAIDSESVARPLWKLSTALGAGPGSGRGWTTAAAISVIGSAYFERLIWQVLGDRIKTGEWDVVHRITPLSPTKGSSIAPKCRAAGIPFVMGPLNGGVPWPTQFDAERRREREWLAPLRSAYKVLPSRMSTLKAAAAIIVGSRHTASEIPAQFRDKMIWLPENAIDPERFNLQARPGQGEGPVKVGFVGRMVPYKGPDMLIEASAPLLRERKMELHLIGDGPILPDLKARAEELGVPVVFHGWQTHREVQKILAGCDLMALPSIREFGGGVVLEAMSLGVPPLVVDYAGPGELVTDDWGYKVPLGSRDEIVRSLTAAFGEVIAHPDDLARRGSAARSRVAAAFTWARKAEQITEVYDWVTGKRADKPVPLDQEFS